MSFNKDQFKTLIEKVLDGIDLYSVNATMLLLGTMAQESQFGTFLRQHGNGPARGVFQMEPFTEQDIWINFLLYRLDLGNKIYKISRVCEPDMFALEYNLAYQICMARIHYFRKPEPLPQANDIEGMAVYWKKHYNTVKGKGKVSEFSLNYSRYVK